MLKDINTSEIDKILKSEAESLKNDFDISKRQFAVFGYNTIFKKKNTISKLENISKEISKEKALFPTMNPNLFGGLPSIFSCKPELRVTLNPGDVILCFPNKTKKIKGDNKNKTIMKKYFKDRGNEPPERCLTLVMIVIKKIDLKHIPNDLSFKYCKEIRNVTKYPDCEYIPQFADDLLQAGDITAKFFDGKWVYIGKYEDPHFHNDDREIKSLNDKSCKYRNYLDELADNERPFSNKGCKRLSCKMECNMRSGTWKYDILFNWGLLGSLKKDIPIEFRSFYLGSKGWPLKDFADRIGAPNLYKNSRWHKKEFLNKNGPEILQKLREDFNIK